MSRLPAYLARALADCSHASGVTAPRAGRGAVGTGLRDRRRRGPVPAGRQHAGHLVARGRRGRVPPRPRPPAASTWPWHSPWRWPPDSRTGRAGAGWGSPSSSGSPTPPRPTSWAPCCAADVRRRPRSTPPTTSSGSSRPVPSGPSSRVPGSASRSAVTGGNGFLAMRTVAPSHLASTLLVLPLALVWHHPVRAEPADPGAGPPDRAARDRAAVRLRRGADAGPGVLPTAVAGLVGTALRAAGDQRRAAHHGRDQHPEHRTRPRTVRRRRRPRGAHPCSGDHPGAGVPGLRRPADLPAVPGGRSARQPPAPAARRAGARVEHARDHRGDHRADRSERHRAADQRHHHAAHRVRARPARRPAVLDPPT